MKSKTSNERLYRRDMEAKHALVKNPHLQSAELVTLAENACQLLGKINRSDPIGEAQVAAAEILHCLSGISEAMDPGAREGVLLKALGSGRAAVGALGFALAETRSSHVRGKDA